MKDNKNKKIIAIVVLIVIVLLICLLSIRSCEKKDDAKKDKEIVDKNKDNNQDDKNMGDELTVDDSVTTSTNKEASSKPRIELSGSDLVYIEINSEYQDLGAKAIDEKYGDLTEKMIVENSVDVTKLGTYLVTYTVTNNDNETVSVTRKVIVQDTTAPTIEYMEGVQEGDILFVDANKNAIFTSHAVIASDNSKGNIAYEITYFYKAHVDDEYALVEDMDLSQLGYYQLHYTAVDESNNRSEDTLVIEYQVRDVKGPNFVLTMNGTKHPMMNPTTVVEANDDYTDVVEFYYSWVSSLTMEPVWMSVENGTELSVPSNGSYYLLLKATDALGNESTLTSEIFEKDDTLMAATNFNLHHDMSYSGVNAGVKINKLNDITEIQSVVAKLYSGDTLLATNTATNKIYELSLTDGSIELSTPFIVNNGTYVEEYWTTVQNTAYTVEQIPTKVVFEVTKTNGQVLVVENNQLVEPNVFWEGNFYQYDILVGTTKGNYQSLNEAVFNANDNDIILVMPGVYDGTLSIDKNVTIYSLDRENTVITTTSQPVTRSVPNAYGVNPVIYVENGSLTLENITVTSNLNQYTAVDGITVNNGNLNLDSVIITNIKNTEGYNGMQYGRGVTAYGTSFINIDNSHINQFNKNGAHFVGSGVTANINNTTFIGSGINENAAAQNGIVFMDGASGSISNCVFSNFQYHDTTVTESYGILLYNNDLGTVQIDSNNIFSNCDQEY